MIVKVDVGKSALDRMLDSSCERVEFSLCDLMVVVIGRPGRLAATATACLGTDDDFGVVY